MTQPLSISKAAKLCKTTRQAIYKAIWAGRLRAMKLHGQMYITMDDLAVYRKTLFDKSFSTHNGTPTFDRKKGEISVKEASELLRCHRSHAYYLIKSGQLPARRKGGALVVLLKHVRCLSAGHLPQECNGIHPKQKIV